MNLIPLKTPLLKPGHDLEASVLQALDANGQTLKEGDILVVASKVVSYAENCLVESDDIESLVRKEADEVFGSGKMVLTVKNGIVIPNAGVDSSNVPKGQLIVWPKDPFQSAQKLRSAFDLKKLGVVISDSTVRPRRLGVSGIAIAWAGFEGIRDERGKTDLFGKTFQYTQLNMADDLAAAAELLMGSTDASIPFVLVRGLQVTFANQAFSAADYAIDREVCLYRDIMPKHG